MMVMSFLVEINIFVILTVKSGFFGACENEIRSLNDCLPKINPNAYIVDESIDRI